MECNEKTEAIQTEKYRATGMNRVNEKGNLNTKNIHFRYVREDASDYPSQWQCSWAVLSRSEPYDVLASNTCSKDRRSALVETMRTKKKNGRHAQDQTQGQNDAKGNSPTPTRKPAKTNPRQLFLDDDGNGTQHPKTLLHATK